MVKCNVEDGAPAVQVVDNGQLTSEHIIVPETGRKNSASGRTSSHASSYEFRLQEQTQGEARSVRDKERDTVTSVSAYSTYKQRIDSMFDETRSQMSCYGGTSGSMRLEKILPVVGTGDDEEGKQKRINNTVQARIEKMFAEMAQTGGGGTTKEIVARKPSSNAPPSPTQRSPSISNFPVDYLGSVPLPDKVTSLHGLQEPLKNLYFAYRRAMETQHDRIDSDLRMRGTLEINSSGLKVHHIGQDKGELEQLNPFPTIAVWAAVKFVCRVPGSRNGMEYAFLPLIADPDAIDKGALFQPLNAIDEKTIVSTTHKHGTETPYNHHSPMFAVVMRKMGVSKQLECHGFVCACSEDAIVIAANLYQALMNNMQNGGSNNGSKSSKTQQNRSTNQNSVDYVRAAGDTNTTGESGKSRSEAVSSEGVRSSSKAVAVTAEDAKENGKDKKRLTVTKVPPPVPVRPPRRIKKSSASSASDDGEDFATQNKPSEKAIAVQSTNVTYIRNDNNYRLSTAVPTATDKNMALGNLNMIPTTPGVRRTVSDRQNYSSIQLPSDNPEGGDILTKVAIPRSRSFLNAGGPLTRYNRRQGSGVPCGNNSGGTGSSPLGFNELFTEFRLQEGLNSMDDILDAIIDSEGMSFNDLKPIYKEFLMKLAVTLTKDELYQRSKSIMRRQKKKLGRRNSCYKRKKTFVVGGGGLKRVFRRSVNKLKPTKSRFNNFEFTSVLFPSDSIRSTKKANKKITNLETSSTSTSSYSVRTFKLPRQPSFNKVSLSGGGLRLQRKSSSNRRRPQRDISATSLTHRPPPMTSTSEDSDFFSMVRCSNNGINSTTGGATTINSSRRGPNMSSSGYFSCSECSYDSESCTCTSADKCYCSLGDAKKHPPPTAKDLSMSSCGCDTDSCIDSDKCYCACTYHKGINKVHHHPQQKHCIRAIPDSHLTNLKPNHLKTTRNDCVFQKIHQSGFVASESSLSRAASPTTAWRRNEKHVVYSKKKDIYNNKSSKSLDFLQNDNPPSFRPQYSSICGTRRSDRGSSRRMDVYDQLPRRQSYQHSHSTTQCSPQRRSYSSDNLALDYDLFTTSSKSEDEEPISQTPQRKVLVVSARDPRGRVIYMGASCRSGDRLHSRSKQRQPSSLPGAPPYASGKKQQKCKGNVGSTSAASEALSVKKSAEIAALFSDVKLTQTADTVPKSMTNMGSTNKSGEVFYNTLEPADYFLTSKTRNNRNCMGSGLENSLGYLP